MRLGPGFMAEPVTVVYRAGADRYESVTVPGMWRRSASATDDSDGTRREGTAVTVQVAQADLGALPVDAVDGQAIAVRGGVEVSGTRREVLDAVAGTEHARVREVVDRRRNVAGLAGLARYLSCVVLECR